MKTAVVGHVEWVNFLRIDRVLSPGAIALAGESWEEPAGGGGVAAVELARLAGHCTLLTALGSDPVGRAIPELLEAHGVTVRAASRPGSHRRAVTLLDPSGERTIVVVGPAQAASGDDGLAMDEWDAVYFCKGDASLLRQVRRAARVLVATARILPILQEAGVQLDALVHSASDPSERYVPGELQPEPRLVATTEGAQGGRYRTAEGAAGRWQAAALPGAEVDTYGAGDSFAAGLAFALGEGRGVPEALAFAANRGAQALCRRGAHRADH
jgi:ribokinase